MINFPNCCYNTKSKQNNVQRQTGSGGDKKSQNIYKTNQLS